ncbi:hypothetical protein GOP47_0018550 [Adiantum capillus-veneris]|uniref:Mediator of RNA polymerase II transcription subunit 11 n=1 Tax=Adiantum capillus-veneris TaxID=13818 RepID=A0A9D4UEV9_ADICA|nr:hypothetical protein GOP47_0018550 [Adiantum capillus-veneris]
MSSAINTTAASQSTSLQRLCHVEKKIVHAVDLAGRVMEELASSTGSGPRAEVVAAHCQEFMQSVKDIQVTLREEIKGMCDYRAYENCDYVARMSAEISTQKLVCVIGQIEAMLRGLQNVTQS